MRTRRVLLCVAVLCAACGSGDDDLARTGSPTSVAPLKPVAIEYGQHELRDVLASGDGGAWLISGGPAVRVDAAGEPVVTADPSRSGDPAMAGVLAAVETPSGLVAVLGGCDCEDGRSIASWLVRFDATTGDVAAYRLLERDALASVAYGDAGLWAMGAGSLHRLDPESLDDVLRVGVDDAAGTIAVGRDAVYVGNAHVVEVQRLDAGTGRVTATFSGKAPVIGAMAVAAGDSVWTIERGAVVELDPTSLEPLRRVALDMRGGELDLADGTLWLYTESGLYSIDTDKAAAMKRLDLAMRHIGTVDAEGGSLWLTDYIGGRLYRAELK